MIADDSVQQIYDLAKSAVRARQTLDDAVKRGLATTYHRTLRTNPEAQVQRQLLQVRGVLSRLARERKAVADDPIQSEQVTAAMKQVAAGALLWVQRRTRTEPPPPQPQPPAPPEAQEQGDTP